jgi:DNA-binding transcriptional LysR family regulator
VLNDGTMLQTEPRVTLSQLKMFRVICETGSYSQAALELNQSQSTLSHAIVELESALGKRLLERGRQGAKPTDFGLRILEHAINALVAVEALEQTAQLERDGLKLTLKIATIRSLGSHVLPGVIQKFQLEHPGVQFEVLDFDGDDDNIPNNILDGVADIGLVTLGQQVPSGILEWEIAQDEYMLIWTDDGRITTPSWQELHAKPFIRSVSSCAKRLEAHLEAVNQKLEPAFNVGHDNVVVSMVNQGLGYSIMPALAVHPLPRGVRSFQLPDRLTRRLGVMTSRAKSVTPAVKAFIEALRDWKPLD